VPHIVSALSLSDCYRKEEQEKGEMVEACLSGKTAEWRPASGEPAIKGCGAAKKE